MRVVAETSDKNPVRDVVPVENPVTATTLSDFADVVDNNTHQNEQ